MGAEAPNEGFVARTRHPGYQAGAQTVGRNLNGQMTDAAGRADHAPALWQIFHTATLADAQRYKDDRAKGVLGEPAPNSTDFAQSHHHRLSTRLHGR